ncbi:hypothetical protein L1049_015168 [Liquidambar formosana]|uniref:Fe2OG dioxygenase domain-containing protein n=1 Tax=Liquidambar formosana TaxID=63359 RepID=A0AAP0WZJ4_LIQFO
MEVDPAFIQDIEHRPKPTIVEAEDIPVIDLSATNSSDLRAIAALVAQIGSACKDWGFFQVINHGVRLDVLRNMETAARKFFAQSKEEKKKVGRDEVNPLGYYDTEHTKNVRDWKENFDFSVNEPVLVPASHEPDDKEVIELLNRLPESPPEFRGACKEYAQEVEKLSKKLLQLICLSLGLPWNRLNGYFEDQMSFVRFNHYPPCPVPHLALGVGRHKDISALTILAQDDVGGLEVKRKTDGEWIRVKPTPDAYIINVGDILQVWSNEKYESVEHRVVANPAKDRLSIAFFFNPPHYTTVEPLEELINEQNPSKYNPYNWGKFFASKRRSNFKKLDVENIQVAHFRVSE